MLDVDFEWFDPQPEVDFHGIKSLLQQLLDVDGQLFDLSALTDLILSQPLLGSTVKVDGNETDAYAFLSVLNLQEHKVWHCDILRDPSLRHATIGKSSGLELDQIPQEQSCLKSDPFRP